MLLAWFEVNKTYEDDRKLTYFEFSNQMCLSGCLNKDYGDQGSKGT